jgi:hypothetical protein
MKELLIFLFTWYFEREFIIWLSQIRLLSADLAESAENKELKERNLRLYF